MNRKDVFDLINPHVKCYAIGEHESECKEDFVILKFDNQMTSISNSRGGWQYVDIYCYVPFFNIVALDLLIDKVINLLKDKIEFIGDISPEILEPELKAYSRKISFRFPKEV